MERKIGGRAVACPLDIPNHTSQINRGDPLFNDLWSRGCYSSGDWIPNNDGLLGKSLELIEERRENAMVQLAYYQHKLKQGHDANVKLTPLAPSDLVLSKVIGTAKNTAWGTLGPNWEGSYRITSVTGIGAYFLKDLDEHVIPCP